MRVAALAVVFGLVAGGTFFLAYRASRAARHFRELHEPIRPWMSIPFLAHTHHVPEAVLFQAIGVTPRGPRDRRPIYRLAHELHRPAAEVISQLQHAIDAAEKPPQ